MRILTGSLLTAAAALIFCGHPALGADNFRLNSAGAADIGALSGRFAAALPPGDVKAAAAVEPPGPPAPAKKWTVMVFMNAKNNLSESMLWGLTGKFSAQDISEMKKVGSSPSVNVLVEHGVKGGGSTRMLIEKKTGYFSTGEKVYGVYPDADMGDYRRVIEFVNWSKRQFPAERYMLILWNHGLGWIDPVMKPQAEKGILFDDETKNYVRTAQLGDILRQSGYEDIFMTNACLMQMAEVGYEIKDNAGLIVGSEETMLAQGYDYEKLLKFMNANPSFTPEQFADFMMNWYREFYAGGMPVGPITVPLDSIPSTLSAVRPGALNDLPAYMDRFALAVMGNSETEAIKKAIVEAVRFSSLDPAKDKKKMIAPYVDLADLADVTARYAVSQETRDAAAGLIDFVRGKLVMRSIGLNKDAENGYDYSRAGGVSVYMTMKAKPRPPQLDAVFETKYGDLSFSKASKWDEFVDWSDKVWLN